MSRPQLVDDAQAAAGRGWRVFPLVPGRKQPRKAATDWETVATSDAERIARWWAVHPADNVAVATGPSGLVVVDLDVSESGVLLVVYRDGRVMRVDPANGEAVELDSGYVRASW